MTALARSSHRESFVRLLTEIDDVANRPELMDESVAAWSSPPPDYIPLTHLLPRHAFDQDRRCRCQEEFVDHCVVQPTCHRRCRGTLESSAFTLTEKDLVDSSSVGRRRQTPSSTSASLHSSSVQLNAYSQRATNRRN